MKENIKKVINTKHKEITYNCKKIATYAFDCNYKDALKMRAYKDKEMKKAKFLEGLMDAMNKEDKEKIEIMNYEIKKDPYLNCYIVWECHNNYMIDMYHGRLKRECKQWLKENIK